MRAKQHSIIFYYYFFICKQIQENMFLFRKYLNFPKNESLSKKDLFEIRLL